jgi:hypothetical protein
VVECHFYRSDRLFRICPCCFPLSKNAAKKTDCSRSCNLCPDRVPRVREDKLKGLAGSVQVLDEKKSPSRGEFLHRL